jgi:hypothetical protein
MRQTFKERRRALQGSGLPLSRVMTAVLMLAILTLMFSRLRDPSTWRWFSHENNVETQAAAVKDESVVKKLAAVQAAAAHNSATGKATPAVKAEEPKPTPVAATKPVAAPQPVAATEPVAPAKPGDGAQAGAAGGNQAASDEPIPPELVPTGPTDLDPLEKDDIRQTISAVSDGNLKTVEIDMPAYQQILGWVDHQSTALLRKRAKKDATYSDFRLTPDTMRLQIVELKLNVRQIIRLTNPPKNGISEPMTSPEGHPLYEVRGFTEEGGSNLFFGFVTDLPEGMPIGMEVNEEARLVGYFFKLQGYLSKEQLLAAGRTHKKPVPLLAPIILGRLVWTATPSVTESKTPIWLLAAIGSGVAVLVAGWVLLSMRKPRRRILPPITQGNDLDPEGPSVDDWLDQAQSGRLSLDTGLGGRGRFDGGPADDTPPESGFGGRFFGNSLWENGESNNGHGSSNGHGNLGPEVRDSE